MRIEGGIDTGNLHASGQGTGDFAFTITRAGFVTSGNLSVSESIVTTGPQGTFHSSTAGALPLNGDARNVSGAGTMTFHIDTPFGPVDGPVDAEISLIPLRTTCTRASGDAAIPERQFQAAEGIGTNVTAEFTARRSAGSSGADVAQVARGAARDVQLYLDHPTNSPLAELAGRAVKSLSATVASASACGGRPAGFEHGTVNADVGAFRRRELLSGEAGLGRSGARRVGVEHGQPQRGRGILGGPFVDRVPDPHALAPGRS